MRYRNAIVATEKISIVLKSSYHQDLTKKRKSFSIKLDSYLVPLDSKGFVMPLPTDQLCDKSIYPDNPGSGI